MTIYKNKKTKRFYILIESISDIESRYLNIEDKYTYTIPNEDMVFWLCDNDTGYYVLGIDVAK
jgi:hypothetical protein